MTREDWFLLILTFITGMMAGFYVYVVSFKPTYAPEDFSHLEDLSNDFSVIGKIYGGTRGPEFIRPSFRVTESGRYSYLRGGEDEEALSPVEGELPRALIEDLKAAASPSSLAVYEEPVSRSNCDSARGGYDYEYFFVVENEEYTLDTCKTELYSDDDLNLVMEALWQYINNPEAGYISGNTDMEGETLTDFATEFLRERLSPYED